MARRSLRELGAVPNKEALVRNGPLSPELCSVSEGTQRRPGMAPSHTQICSLCTAADRGHPGTDPSVHFP